jgi:CubicO group peptidase (beta-lactamase class C family)
MSLIKSAVCLCALALIGSGATTAKQSAPSQIVMDGVPPTRDSQVSLRNYRDYSMSKWAFRNAGAPLHVVMIPRQGDIATLGENMDSSLGNRKGLIESDASLSFDQIFEKNDADGLVVVKGNEIVHQRYFGEFNAHAQHIWFSMTKSLVSTAFGLLVEQGKVDLTDSPAKYIPELKGSGFARVTIQNVLDMASAIDFKENYTDPNSDFATRYAPALSMGFLPGAADADPAETKIYGVHDFVSQYIKADTSLNPGDVFDYNSSNADVLGWLIARISGTSLQDFIQTNIWAKIGAEHDAYIAVDRAFMPVATGGMNSTTRDAARFGMLIRDRGAFNGQQVIPAKWIDASLDTTKQQQSNMLANQKYSNDPWAAYHNMWWILDESKGEYCAVGIHGQVIYINRAADTVMVWFSSQAGASSANNPTFHDKLTAARELAKSL